MFLHEWDATTIENIMELSGSQKLNCIQFDK